MKPTTDLGWELTAALEAAERAAALIRREYQSFAAIPDAPANITTAVDRQAQELILDARIPDPSSSVVTRGHDQPTVRAKGCTRDGVGVAEGVGCAVGTVPVQSIQLAHEFVLSARTARSTPLSAPPRACCQLEVCIPVF